MTAASAHFFEFTPAGLKQWCAEHGLRAFVADQLFNWVYEHGVVDVDMMTNIAKADREVLRSELRFTAGQLAAHQTATDGTEKLLIEWMRSDCDGSLTVLGSGKQTECVMIPTEHRRTACISSQIGCPVGCRFCASGLNGVEGNLRAGEIIEQVHWLTRLTAAERITNVVFMGMGEPLANYAAVTSAIRTLNASWGFGISARRITISTVGLPAAIRKLASFEIPVTLALSLHAPNDELRRQLIPWAEYATIDELLDACDEYFQATGREITLEYLLLGDVNDQPEHARQLAEIAGRLRANINLIRYNEVAGLPFERPHTESVLRFQQVLRTHRRNVHIRASRGRDIAAACGQLRRERAGSA